MDNYYVGFDIGSEDFCSSFCIVKVKSSGEIEQV